MITARRVARELALLSAAQVLRQPKLLDESDCRSLILMAVRTLASDVRDTLEQAGTELSESQRLLNHSEFQLPHLKKAQMVLQDALNRAEKGLNKIGAALDLPEILYFAHQEEVQAYAIASTALFAATPNGDSRTGESLNGGLATGATDTLRSRHY